MTPNTVQIGTPDTSAYERGSDWHRDGPSSELVALEHLRDHVDAMGRSIYNTELSNGAASAGEEMRDAWQDEPSQVTLYPSTSIGS